MGEILLSLGTGLALIVVGAATWKERSDHTLWRVAVPLSIIALLLIVAALLIDLL